MLKSQCSAGILIMGNFLQVSTKGHYGLALMAHLAGKFKSGKFISLKEIGDKENISSGYLEEIAAMLKKTNLITSRKGKSGGYKLNENPQRIKILDIVEALEGPLMLVNCLGTDKNFICANKNCASKKIWRKIQNSLYDKLKKIKLGEFIL